MTSAVVLAEATKTDVDSAPVSEVRRDRRNGADPGSPRRRRQKKKFAPAAASSASAPVAPRARVEARRADRRGEGPSGATEPARAASHGTK